jgi:thymidylate synthase
MIGQNMGEIYYDCIRKIKSKGEVIDAGSGGQTLEITNQQVTLNNPSLLGIQDPSRKWNEDYAIAEFLWYLGRDPNVGVMNEYASIWGKIKDEKGEVESNYGEYIFSNQWYWIVNELEADPFSRRAVISIYKNEHKFKNDFDHPCTMYIQFLIRNHKLHLIWNMRSCDLIYGLCNDMFCAALILQLMTNEFRESDNLHIDEGSVSFNIGSLHVYEKHWPMIFKAKKFWGTPHKVRGQSYHLTRKLTQSQLRLDDMAIYGYMSKEQCDAKINQFNKTHIKGYL